MRSGAPRIHRPFRSHSGLLSGCAANGGTMGIQHNTRVRFPCKSKSSLPRARHDAGDRSGIALHSNTRQPTGWTVTGYSRTRENIRGRHKRQFPEERLRSVDRHGDCAPDLERRRICRVAGIQISKVQRAYREETAKCVQVCQHSAIVYSTTASRNGKNATGSSCAGGRATLELRMANV